MAVSSFGHLSPWRVADTFGLAHESVERTAAMRTVHDFFFVIEDALCRDR